MDAKIEPVFPLRFARVLPLAMLAFTAAFAAPASAQWPTTEWIVREPNINGGSMFDDFVTENLSPKGDRGEIAEKHRKMLREGSIWYDSLGFPAPLQWTEDRDLDVGPGEAYLALLRSDTSVISSDHASDGEMRLTSNPGFLTANTPLWTLMEVSAVHELYHGIQKSMSPSLLAWNETKPPELPECPRDTNIDWLGEGTAAMVQIRWLEGKNGVTWGHPFKGSPRAAWVRHFDQPLHRGSIPPEHQISQDRLPVSSAETVSWACDYGTWYFWYSLGDMIGRNEAEKIAYTRYLFTGTKPWDDGGIANVDAGLKAAAASYKAIRAYRRGLYDLYPQFVAQYLREDRFYGHLEKVELGTPDLYQTTSSQSWGPLGPLATRAWRVRVRLPQNVSSYPYNVRFTLDALDGADRDDLHLIVDEKVAPRPVDPTAPYADVQRTNLATPAADGTVEYLVRVGNVAETASETSDAGFSLRVEVDGFYGSDVSDGPSAGDIDRVAGQLPPGFDVRGPGPWSCRGNSSSRAIFDLVTPDERAQNFDRSMPQASRNTENWLNDIELGIQKSGNAEKTREEFAAFREQMEAMVTKARAEVAPIFEEAADDARAKRTTTLGATFVGQSSDGECQMTLGATLAGREGGAQILSAAVDDDLYPTGEAPAFSVRVHPTGMLRAMRAGRPTMHPLEPRRGDWEICTMTGAEQQKAFASASRGSCPAVVCTPGKLTLETAEQGRIAGTFQFDVIHWREDRYGPGCDTPLGRDTVVGHFNVSSTAKGNDDAGLGGIVTGGIPGAPIL